MEREGEEDQEQDGYTKYHKRSNYKHHEMGSQKANNMIYGAIHNYTNYHYKLYYQC